jgi:hypothetical protein
VTVHASVPVEVKEAKFGSKSVYRTMDRLGIRLSIVAEGKPALVGCDLDYLVCEAFDDAEVLLL